MTIGQDLRFAVRALRRSPGFTAVAILTLACGIGANTAIFSCVRGYLMRPLPVNNPHQLLVIAVRDKHIEMPHGLSYLDYLDYHRLTDVFSDVVARAEWPVALTWSHAGQGERLWAEMVSGNYFDALGVAAVRGRTFLPGEERAPVVILSWDCWQRRFGSDPAAIGSVVNLNGRAFTVIGVGPPEFHGTQADMAAEAFAPLLLLDQIRPGIPPVLDDRDAHALRLIARLRPGKTLAAARAAAEVLSRQLAVQYPKTNRDVTVMVVPETEARPEIEVASAAPRAAIFLMASVGFVLLIACANIANLLLVRANHRLREVAIRTALGASRWRVIRLLIAESMVLSIAGGIVGALLATWATALLSAVDVSAVDFPVRIDVAPDRMVFVFAFLASLLTGVVCGLAPALQASRPDLSQALKQAGALFGGGRRGQRRLSGLLVVSEVALSLILLLMATAFIRAGRELRRADLGLDENNVQLLSVDLTSRGYSAVGNKQFQQRLLEKVKALPGVGAAALARAVPFDNHSNFRVFTEEQAPTADTPLAIMGNIAGPGYFHALGVPLLAGREFEERDDESAPLRCIVNEALARRLWRGLASPRDALGRRVRLDTGAQIEVVGVAKTGKYLFPVEEPRPFLYLPLAQNPGPLLALHVRTTRTLQSLAPALRETVRALDADVPVYGVKTLKEHLDRGYMFSALNSGGRYSGIFGLLGLSLAAIGIYGVIAHSVSQRTREIGIRISLGATGRDILALVVRQGMGMVLGGVAIGLTGAWVAVSLLTRFLLRVEAGDSVTFGAVTLILTAVALLACYLPSRRAARVDPMVALRWD